MVRLHKHECGGNSNSIEFGSFRVDSGGYMPAFPRGLRAGGVVTMLTEDKESERERETHGG